MNCQQLAPQLQPIKRGDSFLMARIERHSDELALGSEPTEPLEPLLQYTQALRDVPQQSGFPGDIDWPVNPLCAAMKGAHDATTN